MGFDRLNALSEIHAYSFQVRVFVFDVPRNNYTYCDEISSVYYVLVYIYLMVYDSLYAYMKPTLFIIRLDYLYWIYGKTISIIFGKKFNTYTWCIYLNYCVSSPKY